MASYIAHPVEQRSHSATARVLDRMVVGCGLVPYALVGLILRLVMARVFFLSGQAKIVGPSLPLDIGGFTATMTLPAQVRDETIRTFETQFAAAPVWPTFAAYFFSYAEFILPICLVIGFGTRMAAFILLLVTAALQLYAHPEGLWTTYVYWECILLALMTCGPGAISLDRVIRYLYQK